MSDTAAFNAHAILNAKPRFIGTMLGLLAIGASLALCTMYFMRFGGKREAGKKVDRYWLQGAVAALVFFSIIEVICLVQGLYYLHVTQFGDYQALVSIPDSEQYLTLVIAFTVPIAQTFFASRCWLLMGKPWWFAALIGIIILYVFASGIAVFGLVWTLTHLKAGTQASFSGSSLAKVGESNFSVAVAADLIINVALTFKLRSWIKDVRMPSQNFVWRYLLISIQTCLISSGMEIAALILSLLGTDRNLYFYVYPILPQVYVINLLLQLLNRPHTPAGSGATHSVITNQAVTLRTIQKPYEPYASAHSVVFRDVDGGMDSKPSHFEEA